MGDAPEMHAALIRPRDFHADQTYPVIVSVYGGPHSQTVDGPRGRYLLDQWLADQRVHRGFDRRPRHARARPRSGSGPSAGT